MRHPQNDHYGCLAESKNPDGQRMQTGGSGAVIKSSSRRSLYKLAVLVTTRRAVIRTVCLCVAMLEANFRSCRDECRSGGAHLISPVAVVVDFSGVHHGADAELVVRAAGAREAGVVAGQELAECGYGAVQQDWLGDLVDRVDEGEEAVAAVGEPVTMAPVDA